MAEVADLDYILADCFLAVGQAVGSDKTLDFDTVIWWHQRYRRAFHHAITSRGTSWAADRDRVTAVGRHLGQRVAEYSRGCAIIDVSTAARASIEVEHGCQMNERREALVPAACTNSPATALSS